MKRIGTAQRFLDAKRERRREVKIKLNKYEVGTLNMMIRAPHLFRQMNVNANPYPCPDAETALEVIKLKQWLENTVMVKEVEEAAKEGDEPIFNYRIVDWEGTIQQRYVTRLCQIFKHYKEPLNVMPHVEHWTTLNAKLNGKPIDFEALDSVSEDEEPEAENELEAEAVKEKGGVAEPSLTPAP